MDVAKTPITDLNISRTEIPALLIEAKTRPYSVQNLDTCAELTVAIEELNGVLGPDLDLPQSERARFSKGRIAQWAVARMIPFRSLIREFSGANRQQREISDAVQAGLARRGFLKGLGAAQNCSYPASPATETVIEQGAVAPTQSQPSLREAQAASSTTGTVLLPAKSDAAPAGPPVFTADPVVQPTP